MKKLYAPIFLSLIFSLASCGVQQSLATKENLNKDSRFLNNVSLNNGNKSSFKMENRGVEYSQNNSELNRRDEFTNGKPNFIEDNVYTRNPNLADFIKDWMGVKYRLGGNDKTGIDCSAFTKCLYAQVYGVSLMRTAFSQFSASIPIYNPDSLKEGDLVFFKIGTKNISHVGVYLSRGYFVQAASSGVMISNLTESYWNKYFYAGGRVKG